MIVLVRDVDIAARVDVDPHGEIESGRGRRPAVAAEAAAGVHAAHAIGGDGVLPVDLVNAVVIPPGMVVVPLRVAGEAGLAGRQIARLLGDHPVAVDLENAMRPVRR